MDKFVRIWIKWFFMKKKVTHATLNYVCKSVASSGFIIFTYILKTLGKSFYRWKQHTTHNESLNIQSIFSQISVYVLALRLGGEMSSRFHIALYMWCVLWGSHLHPSHMKKNFIYFYLISTMGKICLSVLYLIKLPFL